MSKILILSGSPRKGGNTDCLVNRFVEGASLYNDVEVFRICDMNVKPCIGCNVCNASLGNECIQNDEMLYIYEKLLNSDILIIASPVYFYGVSAQLKAAIDRCHTPLRDHFRIRKTGLLLVGAAVLDDLFDPILMQYNMINRFFGLESVGHILVKGVKEKGAITELAKEKLEEAYYLGKSIR